MRVLSTIGALILVAFAAPATGRADAPPAGGPPAASVSAPGCHCPRPVRHAWRRHHARRYARLAVPLVPVAPSPLYDPPIPSPDNPAYDRAMTLHFRSPEVSGTWVDEPGLPHTPPVVGIQHYRVQTAAAVLEYDGLTGEYIPLAQADARRLFPPVAAAPAPPAPAAPAAPAPAAPAAR